MSGYPSPRVYCMKVAVLGDQAVGKTSAVRAFSGLSFESDYVESREVKIWDCLLPSDSSSSSSSTQVVESIVEDAESLTQEKDRVKIRAQFWDCGTKHLDDSRVKRMLDGALCVLITYDVSNSESYKNATSKWLDCARSFCPDAFIVLVGCKCDQVKCRAISLQQVESFANDQDLFFMEISAKNDVNIQLTLAILRIRAKYTMNAKEEGIFDSRSGLHSDDVDNYLRNADISRPEFSLDRDSALYSSRRKDVPVASIALVDTDPRSHKPSSLPSPTTSNVSNASQSMVSTVEKQQRRRSYSNSTISSESRELARRKDKHPVASPQKHQRHGSVDSVSSFHSSDSMTISAILGRRNRHKSSHPPADAQELLHEPVFDDGENVDDNRVQPPNEGASKTSHEKSPRRRSAMSRFSFSEVPSLGESPIPPPPPPPPLPSSNTSSPPSFLQPHYHPERSQGKHREEVKGHGRQGEEDTSSSQVSERFLSPRSAAVHAATQREYNQLTELVRDAFLDDVPNTKHPRASVHSLSYSEAVPLQPADISDPIIVGRDQVGVEGGKDVEEGDGEEEGSTIVVPGGAGVTKMRVHRTGSISVSSSDGAAIRLSRRGDKVSAVPSSSMLNKQGAEKIEFRWKHANGDMDASTVSSSSFSEQRKIKPEEMTLHNRPTQSYLRMLKEGSETASTVRNSENNKDKELGRRDSWGSSQASFEGSTSLPSSASRAFSSRTAPDIFVDVNFEGRKIGTIAVRQGDNPAHLASEFVRKQKLPFAMTEKLTQLLRSRVAQFYEEESAREREANRKQAKAEMEKLRKLAQNAQAPTLRSSKRAARKGSTHSSSSSSTAQDAVKNLERPTLGTLHIKVGKGKVGKLVVREGDDPKALVASFAKTFGLRRKQASQIEERLLMQLQLEQQASRQRRDHAMEQEEESQPQSQQQVPETENGTGSPALSSFSFSRPPPVDTSAASAGAFSSLLFGTPQPTLEEGTKLPSPIRYPSVLTQKQRELLHATLGWSKETGVYSRPGSGSRSSPSLGVQQDVSTKKQNQPQRGIDSVSDDSSSENFIKNSMRSRREIDDNYSEKAYGSSFQSASPSEQVARGRREPPPVPHGEQLFNLDVNLGHGQSGRIVVHENDDLVTLAQDFCARHRLSPSKVSRVQFLLEEKLMLHAGR